MIVSFLRAALALCLITSFVNNSSALANTERTRKQNLYIVNKVIDGDTLKLSRGERVRLIGIDTPESSNNAKTRRDSKRSGQTVKEITALGKQASAFTRNLVEGKEVRLEFDIQQRDRYGRLLAYVYLKDGTFLNAEIIKAGYAQVMTIPPNVKYQDLFLKLQREARENKRGLWNDKKAA